MNAAELASAMIQARDELEESLREHARCVQEAALKDRTYRIAKATSILSVDGTVQEREAHMDQATAEVRYAAKLAEGLETSALEAIRSRRQILSALQSLAAAQREEAALARYESRETSAA